MRKEIRWRIIVSEAVKPVKWEFQDGQPSVLGGNLECIRLVEGAETWRW
jgi:hypothetical protein